MARDLGEPKVTVSFADNTPEEDAAVHKEINYVLSLIWRKYLMDGGDPDVFKKMQDIPPEDRAAYLASKKVSNMRKQNDKENAG